MSVVDYAYTKQPENVFYNKPCKSDDACRHKQSVNVYAEYFFRRYGFFFACVLFAYYSLGVNCPFPLLQNIF